MPEGDIQPVSIGDCPGSFQRVDLETLEDCLDGHEGDGFTVREIGLDLQETGKAMRVTAWAPRSATNLETSLFWIYTSPKNGNYR